MSKFAVGNLLLIGSMICTTVSQVLIKGLVNEVGDGGLTFSGLLELFRGAKFVRSAGAGLFLVAGFTLWVLSLSRLPLSYAYPIASTSVVLIAIISIFMFGETVTPRMWLGTLLILAGIVLLRPAG